MSKYIDLVLCHSEGNKILAEAPSFSHLGEGDLIKLAGFSGYYEVISSIPVEKGSDDYNFWMKMSGRIEKVAAKIYTEEVIWNE